MMKNVPIGIETLKLKNNLFCVLIWHVKGKQNLDCDLLVSILICIDCWDPQTYPNFRTGCGDFTILKPSSATILINSWTFGLLNWTLPVAHQVKKILKCKILKSKHKTILENFRDMDVPSKIFPSKIVPLKIHPKWSQIYQEHFLKPNLAIPQPEFSSLNTSVLREDMTNLLI
jgi:hypothetical protein